MVMRLVSRYHREDSLNAVAGDDGGWVGFCVGFCVGFVAGRCVPSDAWKAARVGKQPVVLARFLASWSGEFIHSVWPAGLKASSTGPKAVHTLMVVPWGSAVTYGASRR